MKHMIISTYSYQSQIKGYIDKRLESLVLKEYIPISKIEKNNEVTFVTYIFPITMSQSNQQRYFKEYIITPIAQAIVDLIQHEFAMDYAIEIIQTNYDFRELEINRVIQDDIQTKKLLNPIIDEMIEKNTFCLDGWIKFRLSEYKMYIINKIERIIFEYQAYKEYEEFIVLLKQFILTQESLIDTIHMIPGYNGSIDLYNEKYEGITKICAEKYTELTKEEYGCQEDLILSTLLTIAPLSIVIHKKERYSNVRLIDTMQSIYENKVSQCQGCEHCNKSRPSSEIIRVLNDILTQKKL